MTPTLNFIGMAVADMGAALAFYRRLGLAIPAEADTEPHVEVKLDGGVKLAWDTIDMIKGFDPGWTPASGSPRMSLAFECASPAEVDRVYAEMIAAGTRSHHQPWDAFWGQRYATILDPDGNAVDLYAAL
jgi:uncharacterized glyoxalase superfamily protein PhnB